MKEYLVEVGIAGGTIGDVEEDIETGERGPYSLQKAEKVASKLRGRWSSAYVKVRKK